MAAKDYIGSSKVMVPKKRALPKRFVKFKDYKIPEGFVLVVDTAEQLPIFGDIRHMPVGLTIVRKCLKTEAGRFADYSVLGYEGLIAIERKQQSDFEHYIQDRENTQRKLKLLSQCFWAGLVVEADEMDLYNSPISPRMTREMVRGNLNSISCRYGVHIYINPNRENTDRYILDHMLKAYEVLISGDEIWRYHNDKS